MVKLEARNPYWHYSADPTRDLCAHGGVFLKIGDNVISDGIDTDWTVSAACYRLLKTIKDDHYPNLETSYDFLIPHCGHTMWAVGESNDELLVTGCDIGIDWTITHKQDVVIHTFSENEVIEVPLSEWRKAVYEFSDEVSRFYELSDPKIVDDDFDRKGFALFMSEWKRLRTEI